jgi:hypothetical protein
MLLKTKYHNVLLTMIFIVGIIAGFVDGGAVPTSYGNKKSHGEKEMTATQIEEALKEHTEVLMSLPGVVGTGQGLCDGKPCIKVFVDRNSPALDQQIHHILEGYPVVIEPTGTFRSLPK